MNNKRDDCIRRAYDFELAVVTRVTKDLCFLFFFFFNLKNL